MKTLKYIGTFILAVGLSSFLFAQDASQNIDAVPGNPIEVSDGNASVLDLVPETVDPQFGMQPMPIHLLYMNATYIPAEGKVHIEWATTTELEVSYYLLLKRDEFGSEVVLGIDSAIGGQWNAHNLYSRMDESPSEMNFYELYAVNSDGEKNLIYECMLMVEPQPTLLFEVGSNIIEGPGEVIPPVVMVTIYDALNGAVVFDKPVVPYPGEQGRVKIEVPVDGLQGLYVVTLIYDQGQVSAILLFQ